MSWNEVVSGEILDIRDGTHDSPKYKMNGYPLITSKNLKHGIIDFEDVNLISEEDYIAINKRSKVDKGDILYSMIGSVGNYAFVRDEPIFAIKNVALFKFNNENLYNRYFLHLINSNLITRQIEKAQKGGTQKFVSLKILRNLKIPLPPLPEQKKIAAILDAADEYRQKTKALIAKYDDLAQSLFLDMFGDPVMNLKGWEKKELEYFCSFDTNMINEFYEYQDYFHVGISNIEKETGNIINCKKIKDDNLISGKYLFDERHIIYSKIRPNLNKVALPGFKGLCSADAYPLLVNKNANRIFLASLLRSKSFIDFILQHSTRTNIPKANKTQMKLYKGIAPPIKLQNQFAERIKEINAQKEQAQKSLEESENLFNALLQKAFKGELT